MNPKFVRDTVKLIRQYFRLQAEVRFLQAMLETAVQADQPPIGWAEALKQARLLPGYQKIAEQHASQLAQLEESADANELARFLGTIPSTDFLN